MDRILSIERQGPLEPATGELFMLSEHDEENSFTPSGTNLLECFLL